MLLLACAIPDEGRDLLPTDTAAPFDTAMDTAEPDDTADSTAPDDSSPPDDTSPSEDTAPPDDTAPVVATCGAAGLELLSPESGAEAGTSGALWAGDLDGDGLADLAVGGPGVARAWVLAGATLLTATDLATPALATVEGQAGFGYFAAHAAADEDGDGWVDLPIGARLQSSSTSGSGVVALLGGAELALTSSADDARLRITDPDSGMVHLGAVADLDGDGLGDLVVGAPLTHDYDNEATWTGSIDVFVGGAHTGERTLDDADIEVQGDYGLDVLGTSLAAADVNADGYVDVLAGAPGREFTGGNGGVVYVLPGAARPYWTEKVDSGAILRFSGRSDDEELGRDPLPTPTDVDGDGHLDILLGDSTLGEAWLWSGASLAGTDLDTRDADAHFTGTPGAAVALAAVDLDADGVGELLIGDPGVASVWAFAAPSGDLAAADADWTWTGDADSQLGASVVGLGDLDGDGRVELATGAPGLGDGGGVCVLVP